MTRPEFMWHLELTLSAERHELHSRILGRFGCQWRCQLRTSHARQRPGVDMRPALCLCRVWRFLHGGVSTGIKGSHFHRFVRSWVPPTLVPADTSALTAVGGRNRWPLCTRSRGSGCSTAPLDTFAGRTRRSADCPVHDIFERATAEDRLSLPHGGVRDVLFRNQGYNLVSFGTPS
jgi:hypothetical protein